MAANALSSGEPPISVMPTLLHSGAISAMRARSPQAVATAAAASSRPRSPLAVPATTSGRLAARSAAAISAASLPVSEALEPALDPTVAFTQRARHRQRELGGGAGVEAHRARRHVVEPGRQRRGDEERPALGAHPLAQRRVVPARNVARQVGGRRHHGGLPQRERQHRRGGGGVFAEHQHDVGLPHVLERGARGRAGGEDRHLPLEQPGLGGGQAAAERVGAHHALERERRLEAGARRGDAVELALAEQLGEALERGDRRGVGELAGARAQQRLERALGAVHELVAEAPAIAQEVAVHFASGSG